MCDARILFSFHIPFLLVLFVVYFVFNDELQHIGCEIRNRKKATAHAQALLLRQLLPGHFTTPAAHA